MKFCLSQIVQTMKPIWKNNNNYKNKSAILPYWQIAYPKSAIETPKKDVRKAGKLEIKREKQGQQHCYGGFIA